MTSRSSLAGLATLPQSLAARLAWLAAYVLAGAFAQHAFTIPICGGHLLWPPAGIALVALILGGRGYIPVVFLGAWLLQLQQGYPWWNAALIAMGCTAAAALSCRVLAHDERFDPGFGHPRDFFVLAMSASLGAALHAMVWFLSQQLADIVDDPLPLAIHWWQGNVLGVLLFTPLLLALWTWWAHRTFPSSSDIRAFLGCLVLLATVGSLPFWNDKVETTYGLVSYCLTLLIVLWAAIRFERVSALLITTFAVIQTLMSAHLAHVALAHSPSYHHGLFFWALALTLVGVGVCVLLLMSHRRSVEAALHDSLAFQVQILNSVAAEVAVLDAQGALIRVNERWRAFADHPAHTACRSCRIAPSGQDYRSSCPPCHDFPNLSAGIEAVLHGESPLFQAEYPCRCPDEPVRWFHCCVLPWHMHAQTGVTITHVDISALKAAQHASQESTAAMQTIINTSLDGFWKTDAEGRLLDVNYAYCQMSGYSREELLRMRIPDLEAVENAASTAQHLEKLMREGRDLFETCHRRKDGSVWNVEISTIVHRSDAMHLFVFLRDVTERTQIQARLAKHEAMLSRTEGIAHVGSWEWHIGTDTVTWSQEMFRLFQRDPAEGAPPFAEHDQCFSTTSMQRLREVIDKALHDKEPFELELEILRADGQTRICLGRGYVHTGADGNVERLFGSMQDIHDRKERENQVHRMAFYDPLTQLPNRRMLGDALAQAMTSSQRSGRHCAVLLLDLDNFKPLNDNYGHLVGDALLIEAGRRISACVRAADTVSRLGGDEFVVLLTELDEERAYSASQAQHIAKKICTALSVPYTLTVDTPRSQTIEHLSSVSIGVTLFVGSQLRQDDILRNADTAMYRAKASGRNAVQFDTPTLDTEHTA
ncbi:GGDEF domain protein [Candidatus Symbiobacter mobilis CR]|uniref:GGDEF domain protein n=2 Tax=Candidatus Symbiobacter TaxID=1436289 RepID=U5N5D6_9BURK|nr:GGDEF domain protein [Candidatus Symbiobacter mobilis CR]